MHVPLLTHSVGSAERAMRALLEGYLQNVGLSFPAWTALVLTNTSLLTIGQLAQRQINGHVIADVNMAQQVIDKLIKADLVTENESDLLTHTEKGSKLYAEISNKVDKITQVLYGDLPGDDLKVTHRTLLEIAKRANSLLSLSRP